MKSYVRKMLQADEQIIVTARLHWIIYFTPVMLFLLATALLVGWYMTGADISPLLLGSQLVYGLAFVAFLYKWFIRWITELTVTNRRVVYGQSFIFRKTVEMNMDKVESVRVDQSILGRLLGYGSVHVLGTGQGIEHLHRMGTPLKIRNAITAA